MTRTFVARPLVGIAFMMVAATLFPVMNGLVKMLHAGYPAEQIIWARNATHLIFVLALFMPRRGLVVFRTGAFKVQMARSICLLASTICFFLAVKYISLAKAATIQFITPFIVTLMAWHWLGEKLVPARLFAVLVGFLGVFVVIRPGADAFDWADLLPVASSAFYSAYQVFTRSIATTDPPETSVVYSALIGTLAMMVFLPFVWVTPVTLLDAVIMSSLGILGGLGHYCVARAMMHGEASVISPFNYWQIVGSTIFGLIVFDEMPDAFVWIGAAIIVAAGVFMAWQESRRRPAA